MDFRLKVFVTAAQTLNYSVCAQKLGISQPAVTKHIKALEQEYNVQVFTRSGGKLRLSYEGELLLERARRIVYMYNDLGEESALLSKAPKGRFLVEIPPPIYYGFLPAFVGEFCRLAPRSSIDIRVTELTSSLPAQKPAAPETEKDNKISITYSSKLSDEAPLLFSDTLVVVGSGAFNSGNYYDLSDLKFLNYSNDLKTSQDILEYFTKNKAINYSNIKVIAQLADSQAIIRLLLSYQKHGKKAPAAVAFLWKSQVAKFVKDGKLQIVNVADFQDYQLPKRYYSISYNKTKENVSFVDFLTNWVNNLIT